MPALNMAMGAGIHLAVSLRINLCSFFLVCALV